MGSHDVLGSNLTELKNLAKKIKNLGGSITITVQGFAQPTKGSEKTDVTLSKNRAKEVARLLKTLGVNTDIVYTGLGRASANLPSSRYVLINVNNKR